jgi:hypothetical protein
MVLLMLLSVTGWMYFSGGSGCVEAAAGCGCYIPYISGSTVNPTYCVVSNNSSDNATAMSFSVTSYTGNTTGAIAGGMTNVALTTLVPGHSQQTYTFYGSTLRKDGTSSASVVSGTPFSILANKQFSGKLSVAAAAQGCAVTGIEIICLQQNPNSTIKRNLPLVCADE